jgi:cyclic-di-AMP phosphodiesterase PgpH
MISRLLSKLRHGYYNNFKVIVFILAVFLTIVFLPKSERFQYEYYPGRPWVHDKLIAPFDFPVYKPAEQLAQERQQINENLQPIFTFDVLATLNGRIILIDYFNEYWEKLFGHEASRIRDANLNLLISIYDSIQRIGILKHHPLLESKPPDFKINLIRDKISQTVGVGEVYNLQSAYDAAISAIESHEGINKDLLGSLVEVVLVQNIIIDEDLTSQELEQAISRLSSTFGMVQQGQLIIEEGELVDDYKYNVLNSLKAEYQIRTGSTKQQRAVLFGHIILTLIIFLILFVFIKLLRPDVFNQLRKINLILLLMLLVILSSYLIIDNNPYWIWYFPFGILPIIMITFFDTRLTLLVHLLTMVSIGLIMPNAFEFLVLQLVVGYVVIFTLMRHNKRIYFFRTSTLLFVTYTIIYLAFSLLRLGGIESIDYGIFVAFAVSSLLTLLALPLIFLLERLFGMITDLTLLELSNTNSPLLRELALVAPGTFQHSMQVAILSEEALFAIGGDTLLARTGALYHDIGKMDNPVYFIENQIGGYNPHDDITFAESARIIIDHVTLGVEKARKAGLPGQIIDFIRTHHGNRRVEYFYLMEQKENPGLELDDRDFSYRGPIPFSKETAVVMMADSVEAASRSIKNPTEQKLNDLVENIVNKQIASNQFINANITFKELDTTKKILKKKLMNIYHVRIAYPE